MVKPFRMLYVYYHEYPDMVCDGLSAAINWMACGIGLIQSYNMAKDITPQIDFDDFDFILAWGAFGSPADKFVSNLVTKARKGLCLGGNASFIPDFIPYDVIFYETEWVKNNYLKDIKTKLIHAFGYNKYVYKNLNRERTIDYLGVGSFSRWKRWERMIDKPGNKMVVGEFQKGNPAESADIYNMLDEAGVKCKDMIPSNELNLIYNKAKTVYIPADIYGGGERAVLEARACGCKVEVEFDNPKLQELLTCPLWDEDYYISQLKKGILC